MAETCSVRRDVLEGLLAAELPGVPDTWQLSALDADGDVARAAGRLLDLATVGRAMRGPAGVRVLATYDQRLGNVELHAVINSTQRTFTCTVTAQPSDLLAHTRDRFGFDAMVALLEEVGDYVDWVLVGAVRQAASSPLRNGEWPSGAPGSA
jgi:hypothetical protein